MVYKRRKINSAISSNQEIQIKMNHFGGPVRFENFQRLISNMDRGMGIKTVLHTSRRSLS